MEHALIRGHELYIFSPKAGVVQMILNPFPKTSQRTLEGPTFGEGVTHESTHYKEFLLRGSRWLQLPIDGLLNNPGDTLSDVCM